MVQAGSTDESKVAQFDRQKLSQRWPLFHSRFPRNLRHGHAPGPLDTCAGPSSSCLPPSKQKGKNGAPPSPSPSPLEPLPSSEPTPSSTSSLDVAAAAHLLGPRLAYTHDTETAFRACPGRGEFGQSH